MAEEDKLTARGASGQTYDFWVYPWNSPLRPDGGVYLVLKKTQGNGRYDLIYVGQTSNLSDRFENHHKKPCFDLHGKTHIGARLENSEKNRLGIEADLIKNYSPNCSG